MKGITSALAFALAAIAFSPVGARSDTDAYVGRSQISAPGSAPLLQCVPYAREVTGIALYGDAHTWWDKARGRYARGNRPVVGAVLAIEPHASSKLGHVAAVSRIVDSRTILVSHANWSVPGKIERNVTVLDVSPRNDWSEVRVWYGPNRNLGTTHWPVAGFIYNAPPGKAPDAKRKPVAAGRLVAEAKADSSALTRAEKRKGRKSDPIGAIIAGRY